MSNLIESNQEAEIITKEQLYKLLHISKRKAKYLLDNGIIPCVDSGKKTRKYTIKMSDVRAFLDQNELLSYPAGIFSSNPSKRQEQALITDEKKLFAYYEKRLRKCADILLISDVVKITGYHTKTVYRWIKKGYLSPIRHGNYIFICKQELIFFMSSLRYNGNTQKSKKHIIELSNFAKKEQQM